MRFHVLVHELNHLLTAAVALGPPKTIRVFHVVTLHVLEQVIVDFCGDYGVCVEPVKIL